MVKNNILIIDDEKDFCSLIKVNLESVGNFEVFVAESGKSGIALAKSLRPDLILLDIKMPHMDGYEVLKRLKAGEDTVSIPVVILSANESDEAKVKALGLYGEAYVTKPVDIFDLKSKIETILNGVGRAKI
ncbi:MAG TPA: response regulator [Candidatus Omnitrophota bacterium]|nr:response regulator [Candidatus Omnitrophota bacterium]